MCFYLLCVDTVSDIYAGTVVATLTYFLFVTDSTAVSDVATFSVFASFYASPVLINFTN